MDNHFGYLFGPKFALVELFEGHTRLLTGFIAPDRFPLI
jgi:hypothetical protein